MDAQALFPDPIHFKARCSLTVEFREFPFVGQENLDHIRRQAHTLEGHTRFGAFHPVRLQFPEGGLVRRPRSCQRLGVIPHQGAHDLLFPPGHAPFGIPVEINVGAIDAVHERTLAVMTDQMSVAAPKQYDTLVFGLADISPYAVGARINPVLVVSDVLGYVFNWFYKRPLVKRGGVVILMNPAFEVFHEEYHVAYKRFYDEVLPATTNALGLLGDMQRAHVLVGPSLAEPFYRDRFVRQVFVLDLAHRSATSRARFQQLNEVALKLYAGWIYDAESKLPDSHLKSVQRLYATVEWLYHALQTLDQAADVLSNFGALVAVLSQSDPFVADLIAAEIRQDDEVNYLLRCHLGPEGVDVACQWLHESPR